MIAQSSQPNTKNRIARLFSPSYPATTLCISFWYKTMDNIKLNVRTYSFGILNPKISFTATNRGNEWSLGQATVSYQASYQIAFEAIDQNSNNASVWLDDIEVNYKSCQPLGSCDFEDGICGFSNSPISDFSWERLAGTFSLTIYPIWDAPTVDHTLGSAEGNFMYLDTYNRKQGQKAIFESETIGNYILYFIFYNFILAFYILFF